MQLTGVYVNHVKVRQYVNFVVLHFREVAFGTSPKQNRLCSVIKTFKMRDHTIGVILPFDSKKVIVGGVEGGLVSFQPLLQSII